MMHSNREEKGQSAVLITFMMIGLIAMMGLIFDGGNAYFQRRRMQNAADAGAFAGGRELAIKNAGGLHSYSDELDIQQYINNYVSSNGGNTTLTYLHAYFVDQNGNNVGNQTSYIGYNNGIPNAATGVSVTIATPFQTYFLSIMNLNAGSVNAAAMVQTGAPSGVADLFPLAVQTNTLTTGSPPPGVCRYGLSNNPPCQIWGENTGSDSSSRQWTSFKICGGGSNFLTDVLNGTQSSGMVNVGDSICTTTGSIDAQASALTQWVDKDVVIPVYDCTSIDTDCPNYDKNSGGSKLKYHVAAFALFHFDGYYFAPNQQFGSTVCSSITNKYLCGHYLRQATEADLHPTKTCPYGLCGFQMWQ